MIVSAKTTDMIDMGEFIKLFNKMKPEFKDNSFKLLCFDLRGIIFDDFSRTKDENEASLFRGDDRSYFKRLEDDQLEIYKRMHQRMEDFLTKHQGTESG